MSRRFIQSPFSRYVVMEENLFYIDIFPVFKVLNTCADYIELKFRGNPLVTVKNTSFIRYVSQNFRQNL